MAAITATLAERSDNLCPVCGAAIGRRGCKDPKACIASMSDRERRNTARYVDLAVQRGLDPSRVLLAGLEALDVLGIGWLVSNSTGRVVTINNTAKDILQKKDGLELDSKGILQETQSGKNSILRMVRRATAPRPRTSVGTDTSATLVQRHSSKGSFTVFVRPVRRTMGPGRPRRRLALVLVMNPELAVDIAPAELHQLYGLTPTETRLTNALVNGKTLQESCTALNITRLTGRDHLDHVFAKAGVHRQNQLISLILKSIGLVRFCNKKTLN
jgi:DNA-binding CsgD family transcriptional regulator